jgi:hypothetical protein
LQVFHISKIGWGVGCFPISRLYNFLVENWFPHMKFHFHGAHSN